MLKRVVYLLAATAYWLATLGCRRHRNGLVVLCYHNVSARQVGGFAWQMRRVAGRTLALADVRAPRPPGRGPWVFITFDDGFRNVLQHALPVLRACRLPAALFVVSACLGRRAAWPSAGNPDRGERVVSAAELCVAAREPLLHIGSHTRTHPRLDQVPFSVAVHELRGSREELEGLLHRPVLDVALPFGAYNSQTYSAARLAGYERVFTVDEQLWEPERGAGLIGRFQASPDLWRIEFLLTCAGAYAWLQPWRRFIRRVTERLQRGPEPGRVPA
ncbi:MAG: polysaccharide deacetylase family protein [Planctomycetota bacterium]